MLPSQGLEAHELDTARRVAAAHELPVGLLDELVRIERDPVGRKGASGVGYRVQEALRRGTGPGTSRGAPPARDTLRLVSLECRNFGLFRDTRLDLEHQVGRPIHLIEGLNGHGKSTLVRALRFVLLGMPPSRLAGLVSITAAGPSATVRVRAHLHSDQLGPISVTRVAEFTRSGDGWAPRGEVDVVVGMGEEQLHHREARTWLGRVFPQKILNYFIFDAERSPVTDLAGRTRSSAGVREQVEEVLGISELRRLAKRCDNAAEGFRQESQHDQPSVEVVETELRAAEAQRDDQAERLRKATERLTWVEAQIGSVRGDLDGLVDAASARDEREDLVQEEARLETRAERQRLELRRWLGHTLPVLLAGPPPAPVAQVSPAWVAGAREATDRTARLAGSGELPWAREGWSADAVLADLLGRLRLPEATSADEGAHARARVAHERARAQAPPAGPTTLAEAEARLHEVRTRLEELAPAESGSSDHAAAVERLQELWREEAAVRALTRDLQAELDRLDAAISAQTDALPAAREAEAVRSRSEVQVARARAASTALTDLADAVCASRISRLEQQTTILFRQLTNKPAYYDRVEFDRESLQYRLLDHAGNEVPAERSTGERAVLALALVRGLQEVSSRSFPVVVEAPLKPLDPHHTSKVMLVFYANTPTQTLLLVKPGELGAHRELIETRVASEHVLHRPQAGVEATEFVPRRSR